MINRRYDVRKKRKPVRRAETMTTTEASFFEKRNHMNSTKSQAIKLISGQESMAKDQNSSADEVLVTDQENAGL